MKSSLRENRIKFIIKLLAIAGVVCFSLLLVPQIRSLMLEFGENVILNRPFNKPEMWNDRLLKYSFYGIILCTILFLFLTVFSIFSNIVIKEMMKITSVLMHYIIRAKLIIFSCLLLLFYVRYKVNLIGFILCWTIWKSGLYKWLIKTFGKQETTVALSITGIAVLFFILVMNFFRVAIVMNVLYGDSNRVFGDFTEVLANHYRVKVHPFYVLFWQSLYHLLCPFVGIKNSIAIRLMIAIFAGLNTGIFSLFVSRLTKSKALNIIVCAIMIFSFPQIYHGAQMLESFIFTQTSLLVMILYFSFALTNKCKYSLLTLLSLTLFVAGNNIAYTCIFGIFYLFLLFNTSNSWKECLNKAFVFSACFILLFSVLLLIQTIIYGLSAPSNIVSIVLNILSEEGSYISSRSISLLSYSKDFFTVLLFGELPLGIGKIVEFAWIWVVLLILPFVFLNKIINKRLFFAVAISGAFLFIFHRYYGSTELVLYSPVISSVYLCLFAFIPQVLPQKYAISIGGILLSALIVFNSFGTYNMHKINQFVFGNIDIADWQDYQQNIDVIKAINSKCSGNKLLFFKYLDTLNKETSWKKTPLHDEIMKAYDNNDIDIVSLPFAEINRIPSKFYFGMENRRKLVFEKDELKDFKTGEILYSFPDLNIEIRPWDYSVNIIKHDGSECVIQETENGVFINDELISGTSVYGGGGGGPPYINIGMQHFNMRMGNEYENPILTQILYPITWGDGTRPHIWHAVELFMYLMELKT